MDLTFETVDELCLAALRNRLGDVSKLSIKGIGQIGPAVEWFESRTMYSALRGIRVDEGAEWDALRLGWEKKVISGGRSGAAVGFFPLSRRDQSDGDLWASWLVHAQSAAESVGFDKPTAHGLVGAILELEGNVEEHSGRPSSGLVGFRKEGSEFEFVVADRGIGVLASLRSSQRFRDLSDAGTALRLALQDGVSRFDGDAARGFGFRQLFLTLASLQGSLRFRSDDHALVIAGQGASLNQARLMQKATFPGFVVSVICRAGLR